MLIKDRALGNRFSAGKSQVRTFGPKVARCYCAVDPGLGPNRNTLAISAYTHLEIARATAICIN